MAGASRYPPSVFGGCLRTAIRNKGSPGDPSQRTPRPGCRGRYGPCRRPVAVTQLASAHQAARDAAHPLRGGAGARGAAGEGGPGPGGGLRRGRRAGPCGQHRRRCGAPAPARTGSHRAPRRRGQAGAEGTAVGPAGPRRRRHRCVRPDAHRVAARIVRRRGRRLPADHATSGPADGTALRGAQHRHARRGRAACVQRDDLGRAGCRRPGRVPGRRRRSGAQQARGERPRAGQGPDVGQAGDRRRGTGPGTAARGPGTRPPRGGGGAGRRPR